MKGRNVKKILGVNIDNITAKEVLDSIKSFLLSDEQHYIVTLNPEMVVAAQKDIDFKYIINEADLSIADGIGILIADRFLNDRKLPERISGIDLIYKICESELTKEKKIFLLGAGKGIAKKAASALQNKYPHITISGAEEGISEMTASDNMQITNEIKNTELIRSINNAKPDIIFVAFGAPKQEKWIYENIKKIPSVRLAIGVGGSFDFISGKIKRAPGFIRKIGLEWTWRFVREPKRIKRIYNATVRFCSLIMLNKIQRMTNR